MPKYFFEATARDGKTTTGAIEAETSQQAVERLGLRGLGDIRLLSGGSPLRNDLAAMNDEQVQRHARLEIGFQKTKSRPAGFFLSVLHVAKGWRVYLAVLGIFAVRDLILGRFYLALLGLLLMLLPFALLIWNRRHLDRYRALQIAMCYGEWDKALSLIGQLRNRPDSNQQLQMDLDVREAQIRVRRGERSIDEAIAGLESWRPIMAGKPGAFEARVGGIYRAGNDFKRHIEVFRASHLALPQEASRQLDLALAEVRFGDVAEARHLMETLNSSALIALGFKFMDWVNGLIALKEGRLREAESLLRKASLGFEEVSRKTPTALSSWSLSNAALALAMARQGRGAEARKELSRVWKLLRVSGDPALMAELRQELALSADA